jgi:hypothetical protein
MVGVEHTLHIELHMEEHIPRLGQSFEVEHSPNVLEEAVGSVEVHRSLELADTGSLVFDMPTYWHTDTLAEVVDSSSLDLEILVSSVVCIVCSHNLCEEPAKLASVPLLQISGAAGAWPSFWLRVLLNQVSLPERVAPG